MKELKTETPVTPIGPRPVTVPTTLSQFDRLLLVTNRTDGLPRVQIQVLNKSLIELTGFERICFDLSWRFVNVKYFFVCGEQLLTI